jgi:tetratricopeptide (TPR) repeat protein
MQTRYPSSSPTGHPSTELVPGSNIAETYKLVKEIDELPQGRQFIAEDARRERQVNLLILSGACLSDRTQINALEQAVHQLGSAPHPMLRKVYAIECTEDYSFLVLEHVPGPTLLDILRKRSVLSAAEVGRLLLHLAPLADYVQINRLQQVELTLRGIQLTNPEGKIDATPSPLLQRPVDAWEQLEAKVNGIDLSPLGANVSRWTGAATLVTNVTEEGSGNSYVRLLSLLAYELLGGRRAQIAKTGRFTPLAALSEDGNAVLRRGIADAFSSATEMARELAASIGAEGRRLQAPPPTDFPLVTSAARKTPLTTQSELKPILNRVGWKLPFLACDWRLLLPIGLLTIAGFLRFVTYRPIDRATPLKVAATPGQVHLPQRLSGEKSGQNQNPAGITAVEPSKTRALAASEYDSRGQEYARQYRWDLAISCFTKAIQSDSQNPFLHSNLAFAYFAKNRYTATLSDGQDNGLTALNEALRLNPKVPLFFVQRAAIYRSMHQYKAALADLNRAIWLKPNLWSAFGARGQIYWFLGRWESAIADLTQAIEHGAAFPLPDWYPPDQYPLDPNVHGQLLAVYQCYSLRASCYHMLGWTDAARRDYATVSGIDCRKR